MAFEWQSVDPVVFTTLQGAETLVRLLHEIPDFPNGYEVDLEGRDIDEVAYEELGTELDSLRLVEANAQRLVEYKFDLDKIRKIKIPQ
jgi:hypothetical protein